MELGNRKCIGRRKRKAVQAGLRVGQSDDNASEEVADQQRINLNHNAVFGATDEVLAMQ